MDLSSTNPYSQTSNFVELLNSQNDSVFCSYASSLGEDTPADASRLGENTSAHRRERKKWTPMDDVLLISSWLNTSKDPVVGNEQKSGAFTGNALQRILLQVPRLQDMKTERQCSVSNDGRRLTTLSASFADHIRLQQERNPVVRLEHAWKELRNDQKWCDLSTTKTDGSSKRRRCEDGSQSSCSIAEETKTGEEDQGTKRPPGVKAAKGKGKRSTIEVKGALAEFQTMWAIQEKDLAMKEKLSKMGILDSLIAKKESLSDYEEALKKKLITYMLAN
ncbi:Glutathione S-transferase T3 [Cardamine amara subsp. amara]|uniref:Glutathione S-transferase T3 n=1 Tax=Cardamine amara subsp. amara TaxID=228776 RepID=A0ABD1C5S4_CARAN